MDLSPICYPKKFLDFWGDLIVVLAKKIEEKIHKLLFMWVKWQNWRKCHIGNESSTRCQIEKLKISSCWHHFLTWVKKGDLLKGRLLICKKPKDVQDQNQQMECSRWARRNILWRCWSARFGDRPMRSCRWSQEERRKPELYKDSDDSVVIFK